MRERLALLVCCLTLVLVVGLAGWFADRHNPTPVGPKPPSATMPTPAPTVPESAPADSPGAILFREQGCTSCHVFGGAGNPRYPLDDVATRRSADELRAWITGTGVAAQQLAGSVARRKQRYLELSPAEMTALVEYLGARTPPAR